MNSLGFLVLVIFTLANIVAYLVVRNENRKRTQKQNEFRQMRTDLDAIMRKLEDLD